MKKEVLDWKRMRFKQNKVWIAVDASDMPIVEKGKVLMKYQLDQPHEYRVHPNGVRPIVKGEECRKAPRTKVTTQAISGITHTNGNPVPGRGTIHVYTDGASSGNPGPAGIGVYLWFGKHKKEISQYIGLATNNIAELEAIRTGLSEIKSPQLPVRIYTDSGYAYGLLSQGWKPKKNQELVKSIKKLMTKFKNLKFVKVKGHAGNEGNEKADHLATHAIKSYIADRE